MCGQRFPWYSPRALSARRLREGFCDDEKAFGLEAIKRVALGSGHYLTDPHTLDFLRKESQLVPHLFAYRSHEGWAQNPLSLAAEAQARLASILANHEVPPLEEALQRELERIAAAAEKELAAA